jgi:hypothetical protein
MVGHIGILISRRQIKKIVKDLLASRVIRPSLSPFSSPVLLVRKANGQWQLAPLCRLPGFEPCHDQR